jgi:C-terminal processing protease CtpA/Prc
VQRDIAGADREGLAGWIVDLRSNGGGNMWPMIAGVGPVLGEGRAGYFIDPDGTESWWEYRDGASWNDGTLMQRVDTPYRLRRELPRVAVLIDRGTASSGEAVLIAFQRRPGTRSFGTATCGLSTANQQYTLSDGASLFLTVSVMADRTKTRYGSQVVPDEEVPVPREAEQRAVAWLHGTGL